MAQWLSGRVVRKTRWNDTHFSLAIRAEGPAFVAGQFIRVGVDLDDQRVGRPYSLVNPPHEPVLEIFFNIVPEGPLSSRLAALEAGDALWLTDAANGFLTLAEVPNHTQDLWMLATGTGVGPFLSMLQTAEPWQRFNKIVLGYGVRRRENLGYCDLIERLQREHPDRFHFVPYVTGEPLDGAFQCRIPETLADGRLERHVGFALDPARSHVMLCGHSEMITDAVSMLEERGLRRHRRREPGHISTEKYH
ncbi:MAG: ferredoxin--NADP reductase [Gammaproteobacteria bacterium]|nr:ferredoxin--NADP reductase [Gammaproteobacteria bacterium]MCP5318002.1 ferredoxin--NADP reductase [Chromatiaceae bacterium]MCW5585902.1 ferredoxin--NADP reductase [Chromatiales bacterium]MCB1818012.1 ferredoxin--NADP reductase [Gammaproteobacteria bacterium]MCP5435398.1 ferredoxin--NADP reductase [Chromatiaceae bacterium]